jgi:hypothetical protein
VSGRDGQSPRQLPRQSSAVGHRQRVRAGLRRAVEAGKQLVNPAIEKRIQGQLRGLPRHTGVIRPVAELLDDLAAHFHDRSRSGRAGKGILAVARECKVGTGTVHRIAREIGRPFDGASEAA